MFENIQFQKNEVMIGQSIAVLASEGGMLSKTMKDSDDTVPTISMDKATTEEATTVEEQQNQTRKRNEINVDTSKDKHLFKDSTLQRIQQCVVSKTNSSSSSKDSGDQIMTVEVEAAATMPIEQTKVKQTVEQQDCTSARLYVSNLPYRMRGIDLSQVFARCGYRVASSEIIYGPAGSKGYGFVTLCGRVAAQQARAHLNQTQVGSRTIKVDYATAKTSASASIYNSNNNNSASSSNNDERNAHDININNNNNNNNSSSNNNSNNKVKSVGKKKKKNNVVKPTKVQHHHHSGKCKQAAIKESRHYVQQRASHTSSLRQSTSLRTQRRAKAKSSMPLSSRHCNSGGARGGGYVIARCRCQCQHQMIAASGGATAVRRSKRSHRNCPELPSLSGTTSPAASLSSSSTTSSSSSSSSLSLSTSSMCDATIQPASSTFTSNTTKTATEPPTIKPAMFFSRRNNDTATMTPITNDELPLPTHSSCIANSPEVIIPYLDYPLDYLLEPSQSSLASHQLWQTISDQHSVTAMHLDHEYWSTPYDGHSNNSNNDDDASTLIHRFDTSHGCVHDLECHRVYQRRRRRSGNLERTGDSDQVTRQLDDAHYDCDADLLVNVDNNNRHHNRAGGRSRWRSLGSIIQDSARKTLPRRTRTRTAATTTTTAAVLPIEQQHMLLVDSDCHIVPQQHTSPQWTTGMAHCDVWPPNLHLGMQLHA